MMIHLNKKNTMMDLCIILKKEEEKNFYKQSYNTMTYTSKLYTNSGL